MDARRREQIQRWMVAFADGDRAAFEPLYGALWPVLLAFAARALEPRADAEDAAQAAIVKVFSRIVDFDRTRDGVTWALGITGYEIMTIRKRRARRREAGPAPLAGLLAGGPDLEEQAIADGLRRDVLALVGELGERDRAALFDALSGGESPRDERTRKQRTRAIERLRAAWRRVHG
jgi:RNA polymerase sigma-70 factor (ECF subfamily)